MAFIGFNHSFLNGLSDFWQRFFSDADQLDAMYRGSAILIGQAYLDLLTNVLGVSLKDAPIFTKEYYKLLTFREDQARFECGASLADDRWVFDLPDDVVHFISLDNRVIEPTASLQETNDYDLGTKELGFKIDPTDPSGNGTPLPGFARRAVDVAVGGSFDDTARTLTETWASRDVRKGDTLRLLDTSTDVPPRQSLRSDHTIVLVRDKLLYVDTTTPLTATDAAQNFVVLRRPYATKVTYESLAFSGEVAQLVHTRLDVGSVTIFAKTSPFGNDVVEGVDYTVDYERGKIYRLTPWQAFSANKANYTWRQEVWPIAGGTPPRFATTGVVRSAATTARVLQMALWAPDALVDRHTLANNFGALIGDVQDSSENYRAFLRGIFQLYILGPVLERIESAINVLVGLPVIRDDGEVLVLVDNADPLVNRVTTLRPTTNMNAVYEFPKATPLRADVNNTNIGVLTFNSFEALTTAITVTDYIQDPTWWHDSVIPVELFSTAGGAEVPSFDRRTISALYVKHVVGAGDDPRVGDPGLIFGADEVGFQPSPGHPVFRHRLAYVLMDRYLKFHTFFVRFDPVVFSEAGAPFTRSLFDLSQLVLSAKPAHTYVFVQPLTTFLDTVVGSDGGKWYQPQRYLNADPDVPEFYDTEGEIPAPLQPYVQLGLFYSLGLVSPPGGPDKVLFTDAPPTFGEGIYEVGDFYRYDDGASVLDFSALGAVSLAATPPATGHRLRAVYVFVDGLKSGKRLVENVDYTVDYAALTVMRITAWDSMGAVTVQFVLLNLGNAEDGGGVGIADTPMTVDMNDPATVHATYDPTAQDWLGNLISVLDARDLGMVERPLTFIITSIGS